MPNRIESIRIKGFRSLADVEIEALPQAAALIGANGSGKSNFIRFFEMMSWMLKSRRLNEFVQFQGGADDQLFGGAEVSRHIEAEIAIRTDDGLNDYRFVLAYVHPDRFLFTEEAFRFSSKEISTKAGWQHLGSGHTEAKIVEAGYADGPVGNVNPTTARTIVNLLRDCAVYQFHDTSDSSGFMKRWEADNSNYLRSHGGNLAAVLLRLKRKDLRRFERICRLIGRVLPIFERFQIEESYGRAYLRWKAKGTDKTFGPYLTSDGSLRFFALTTLLNLPSEMLPDVILLDEPELGLHPAAIALVGGMIRALAVEKQIIVATQSPLLVDAFGLNEIVVLEMRDGKTEVRRIEKAKENKDGEENEESEGNEYQHWLDEFTTGELWQKNILGGQP